MATTIELYNHLYNIDIEVLHLSNNKIKQIRQEIGQLKNLQLLYLNNNQIKQICSEIGQLHNLRFLDLNGNQINNICPDIGRLLNLQELILSNNNINNVCPEIGQLRNLRVFYLYNNKINNVCPEIGRLRDLQELGLSYNKITQMCSEMGQLRNLRILYLNNNKIKQICPEIGRLQNLQKLDLSENQLTIIPANIIQCNNLVSIEYHDNNIEYYIPCVQRFLDRIRNTGGTIVNIYNDWQNVHTSSIQTSIKNSIFNILNTYHETNGTNNYIEDSVLTIKTKQLIAEYISFKETHSHLDCTFEEVFKAVWGEITTLQIDPQNEVKKRLNEEMDDAECKCFTGRISRLVNCLSGYTNKVLIQISDAEQIGNIISHIKSTHNDSSVDEIRQIVENELTERRFNKDIIEEWISYIN